MNARLKAEAAVWIAAGVGLVVAAYKSAGLAAGVGMAIAVMLLALQVLIAIGDRR